jgi:hypothetical protein
MTAKNNHEIPNRVVFIGLLVGLLGCAQEFELSHLEGAWDCTTTWTWDNDGVSVPCSYKQQMTCKNNKCSNAAVLSIGTARWSETTEGACHAKGRELWGTRTSITKTPLNDAARQFERDELDGGNLESLAPENTPRARITSLTESELSFVGDKERISTCNRPGRTP